uniref:Uncharacterized protein n=1 Tax=Panagrolaimus davidi TaxID=227884 RepID=A0A914R0A2_9BILA
MDRQAPRAETPPYCYCRHKPPCYTQRNIVLCYSNFPMVAPSWITTVPPPTESNFSSTQSNFPATAYLTVQNTTTAFTSSSFTHESPMQLKQPISTTPKNKFRYHPMAYTYSRRESYPSISEEECMELERLTAIADIYVPVEPVKQQRTSIHWRILAPTRTSTTKTITDGVLSMMSKMTISNNKETPKKS